MTADTYTPTQPVWEHALFVWPKDHPVTELG